LKTLAIVINYHSASLCRSAVRSIENSDSVGPVQVVVVDNSEDRAEFSRLTETLPEHVPVLTSDSGNLGFGRACNWAYRQYCHDVDWVLLLNPDAALLPGSLERLQRTLTSRSNIGAVGPQIYWDKDCRFYLPPSYIPTWFYYIPIWMRLGPHALPMRILSTLWRCYSLHLWRATRPVRVFNLSGGHALIKKSVIERIGGLFDPRFFMYFEDTDLFLRIRRAGYKLLVDPGATVVHDYNKCGADLGEKSRFMLESFHQFKEKHQTVCGKWMQEKLNRLIDLFTVQDPDVRHDGPVFQQPFTMTVPKAFRNSWLFEWSPNPNFIPAAGWLNHGSVLQFSNPYWEKLVSGRYYGRLGPACGWQSRFVFFTIDKKSG
jgi:GT2 family glycosyltransferase